MNDNLNETRIQNALVKITTVHPVSARKGQENSE